MIMIIITKSHIYNLLNRLNKQKLYLKI